MPCTYTTADLRKQITRFMADMFEDTLESPDRFTPQTIDAAHYAVLPPGHLWRPLITLETARVYTNTDFQVERALATAVATELLHASSLIIDDRPDNDNALQRHGRDSCWKRYNTVIATFASHYLTAQAQIIVAHCDKISAMRRTRIGAEVAEAIPILINGQERDLSKQCQPTNLEEVLTLYDGKTGVLLSLAATVGALAAAPMECLEDDLLLLTSFGKYLGRAYQTMDDCYDRGCSSTTLGKPRGQDVGKKGIVDMVGLDSSQRYLQLFMERARSDVSLLHGDSQHLTTLVDEMQTAMDEILQ